MEGDYIHNPVVSDVAMLRQERGLTFAFPTITLSTSSHFPGARLWTAREEAMKGLRITFRIAGTRRPVRPLVDSHKLILRSSHEAERHF